MNHGIDKEYQSGKHQTVHNIKQPFPRNQKQAQIELPNNSGIVIHILNILLFDQPPQRTCTPCFLCIPVIICKIWRKEIVNSNCNHTSDQDEIKKCFPVFLQNSVILISPQTYFYLFSTSTFLTNATPHISP